MSGLLNGFFLTFTHRPGLTGLLGDLGLGSGLMYGDVDISSDTVAVSCDGLSAVKTSQTFTNITIHSIGCTHYHCLSVRFPEARGLGVWVPGREVKSVGGGTAAAWWWWCDRCGHSKTGR